MKKLISLCALAALYAGPVLAESPAAKVEAVTAPAAASVEKAKDETVADKKVEKKEAAVGSEAVVAKPAEPVKATGEKPAVHAEHTEHKESK